MNLITTPADLSSKDLPLRENVCLLGRILGETLREQEGDAPFQRTCTATAAIAPTSKPAARRRGGSLPLTLKHLQEKPIGQKALQAFLDNALVSPMLTAHPTEVQRKSILDCQLSISRLLSERDRMDMTPDDLAENEETLRRFVLILWQTRMLRTVQLTVHDEINNGLEYYRYTFLGEIPKIYADLGKQLEARFGIKRGFRHCCASVRTHQAKLYRLDSFTFKQAFDTLPARLRFYPLHNH